MEAIEEIPEEVRERLSHWVYDDNKSLSRNDIFLLKRVYQKTWRDNPDWSCPQCLVKCLTRIHKAILSLQ